MKRTSMTAQIILVPMAVRVLTWLTATSASVAFHSLDEIVTRRWIHAPQIAVVTELDARQAQTIKTFTVHVQSAMQVVFATKTSTNVNFHRLLVATAPHVKTPTVLINACVQRATKERTVQSTLMTALLSLVKMVELVSMALEITLACVTKVSKENTAKQTSTNAFPNPVKTELLAINTSTLTLAHVRLDFLE